MQLARRWMKVYHISTASLNTKALNWFALMFGYCKLDFSLTHSIMEHMIFSMNQSMSNSILYNIVLRLLIRMTTCTSFSHGQSRLIACRQLTSCTAHCNTTFVHGEPHSKMITYSTALVPVAAWAQALAQVILSVTSCYSKLVQACTFMQTSVGPFYPPKMEL